MVSDLVQLRQPSGVFLQYFLSGQADADLTGSGAHWSNLTASGQDCNRVRQNQIPGIVGNNNGDIPRENTEGMKIRIFSYCFYKKKPNHPFGQSGCPMVPGPVIFRSCHLAGLAFSKIMHLLIFL
jgi:hypothetical protein